MSRSVARLVGVVISMAIAIGAVAVYRAGKGPSKEMQPMTTNEVTYCVGRYLIDLPPAARVSYSPARIDGVVIERKVFTSFDAFKASLDKRIKEVSAQQGADGKSSLERQESIDTPEGKGAVFYFGRTAPDHWFENGVRIEGSEGVNVEAWLYGHGFGFVFTAAQLDAKYTDDPKHLITQFSFVMSGTVPTAPGFCLDHALIKDPSLSGQHENVTLLFEFKDHPDVRGKLMSTMPAQPPGPLLARMSNDEIPVEAHSRIKRLRGGKRVVNGMGGEEVLESFNEQTGQHVHLFAWETPGEKDSREAPTLSLELETGAAPGGNKVNASLTDAEAIELWDEILASLRPRPKAAQGR